MYADTKFDSSSPMGRFEATHLFTGVRNLTPLLSTGLEKVHYLGG
jgi:hypothetical protein